MFCSYTTKICHEPNNLFQCKLLWLPMKLSVANGPLSLSFTLFTSLTCELMCCAGWEWSTYSVCHKYSTCCLLAFQGKMYSFIHLLSHSFIYSFMDWSVNWRGRCYSTLASPSLIGPVEEVQYCAIEQQWSTPILMMAPDGVIQMTHATGNIIIFCKLYHAYSVTW